MKNILKLKENISNTKQKLVTSNLLILKYMVLLENRCFIVPNTYIKVFNYRLKLLYLCFLVFRKLTLNNSKLHTIFDPIFFLSSNLKLSKNIILHFEKYD